MFYKFLIKPIAFLIDPEKAHHITVSSFRFLLSIPLVSYFVKSYFRVDHPSLEKELFGIKFPNPVGLAAGFDKDGKYYDIMSHLGFGFVEIGTVTPKPQDGNPKQRLFRLPKDSGLINRMGFNNEGVEAMIDRIKDRKVKNVVIGGNIGKNKVTPNENAIDDYDYCFTKLYPYVDYFVVNVSSPNTPGLRSLQDKEPLTQLLSHVIKLRDKQSTWKPVLLKIAPDLNDSQLDDVMSIFSEIKVDGIIATNTTISREGLLTSDEEIKNIGNGGLSGLPLKNRSIEVVKYIRSRNSTLPIIGVGGITNAKQAHDMIDAGADLIQVYSGMVYSGPSLIKDIKKSLIKN